MRQKIFVLLTVSAVLMMALAGCAQTAQTKEEKENSENSVSADADAPVVYMTTDISADGLMAVYEAMGASPKGNIAVKLSTGEPGSNYLRTDLIGKLVQSLDAAIVECNTAYGGSRSNTAMHYQVAVDQACIDLVYSAEDGQPLIDRIESRNGLHTLEHGEEIGLGSRNYSLINIQEENPSETNVPAVTSEPSAVPSDGESVTEPDSEEQAAK